jgi:O-antigen/teichoic acid export membrane protein
MMSIRETKIFNILSRNHLIKSFSYFSLSQAINAIFSFGILALYTKVLPPADFGRISLIWIFVTVATIIIDGRLNAAFSIKYYKVSKEEITKNIYSIFVYNIFVFLLVYFVFSLHPSLFQKILKIKITTSDLNVVFLLILCMIFGSFYTNILIVSQKPKKYFYTTIVFNTAIITATVVYLLILKSGYISYLKAYLVSYFTISIIGFRYIYVNYKPHKNVISLINLKELFKIAGPIIPNSLLLILLTWANRYILNLYSGLSIVGIFSVGYNFSEVISYFIINPFGQAIAPILFKQYAQSGEEYKKTVGRVIKYYWIAMLCIMLAYFVILREVFQLFIGAEYMEGYNIVAILLFGVILSGAATNFLGATVVMKEKTGKMFLFTSISASLNIGLNFILIPRYGMYGAAIATSLSYVLQFIMIFSYTQKLVFISYDYKFILKSIIISLCFFALILCLSYLKVNVAVILGLKAITFLSFTILSYKYLELKNVIKGILDYAIITK